MYRTLGDDGLTCLRCGISHPTLRKWVRRYEADGEAGLCDQSRRPHHSPVRKVFETQEQWILVLRNERNLERLHRCPLSIATIADVLARHNVSCLKQRRRHQFKRYAKALLGERV